MIDKKYIEVEALLDRVCVMRDNLQLELNNPFEDGIRMGIEDVEIEIENTPAADVRPVVRGKWIDTVNYYQRWKCSVCGCHTRDAIPPFCPNCGADMRKEAEK